MLNHFTKSAIGGRASTTDKPEPILFNLLNAEVRNKVRFAETVLKGTGITEWHESS